LESGTKVEYFQTTAEQLAEDEAGVYDIVTCLEMLEHVPDPSSVVRACAALCKPGGDIYFSTINRNPKAFAFAIVGAEYVLKLLPRGTHDFSKFIRPAELANWVREADLQMQHMTGLTYNPLFQTYRLNERDVDVNYMIHVKKPL
jgi:2-polyprenyl-6-hydroxyphenyl methylase/3-demethylubiquinone-9 3-methyltransferase